MTKERLKQYRVIGQEREQIRSKIETLEAQHLPALKRYYEGKLTELAQEQLAIEQAIDSLGPVERMLMRYYYIDGLTWEEVSERICYSWAQTHRLHTAAIEQIEDQPC